MDLVILVPDANWEHTIRQLLGTRRDALAIRLLSFDVIRHPHRDPGVRVNSSPLLRLFMHNTDFALVLLDVEGSGHHGTVADLETGIVRSLEADWDQRLEVIAVNPELENWFWVYSTFVAEATGWQQMDMLRQFLLREGFWPVGQAKPSPPKEALDRALEEVGKPRTSAIYKEVAGGVSLNGCTDDAFARFCNFLRNRFPV